MRKLGSFLALTALGAVCGSASFALTTRAIEPSPALAVETRSELATPKPAKALPQGTPTYAVRDFPRNAAGETYGSDSEAATIDEAPDLIAVVGDGGKNGFVRKHDLERASGPAANPSRAGESVSSDLAIPVFALDGKTRVDTFTLAVSVEGSLPVG